MELIILIGIPASGKSSFYRTYFFNTYMRISLDLFATRNKEQQFLDLVFRLQQRSVVDNTNVTKAERAVYIQRSKANKFAVTGYYFKSQLSACLERNEKRQGKEKINNVGLLAKHKALELPTYDEGFDKLFYVCIENEKFSINNWKDEVSTIR